MMEASASPSADLTRRPRYRLRSVTCAVCGRSFEGGPKAKYCRPSCAQKAYFERHGEEARRKRDARSVRYQRQARRGNPPLGKDAAEIARKADLAAAIARIVRERGLTQRELASVTGI